MIQSQNKQTYGLIRLLRNYLISIPASLFFSNVNFVFPKQINEFTFVKTLTKNKNENVGVALYRSNKGVKVIVKRWEGNFKDYNYYSIKNEANTYGLLNSTLKRISSSMPAKYKRISIPKLLAVNDDNNSFTMIIEWIDGKTISGSSSKRKVDAYLEVRDFLQYLGKKIRINERKQISRRIGFDYLLLFPVVLIVAIAFTLDDIFTLMYAAILFLSYTPTLLKNTRLTLVHRDLHFDNIMISNKKIYVIDLQFCVFTYSACEIATTLRYLSNDKKLSKYFLENILKRDQWTKEDAYLLKPMIIMLGVHGLTGRKFTKKIISNFKIFLKEGIQMDSKILNIS